MKIRPFIGGHFEEPATGDWLDNREPATGEIFSQVANCGADDVARAVERAQAASPAWGALSVDERSRWLHRIADEVERRLEEFAVAETRDSGKPISLSRNIELPRAVQNFRFFASLIVGSASQCHDGPGGLNVTLRQPWGVVGTISPWNLPLYLLSWKIAPALAAGNCVVAKPSELTPLTAMMLGEVCQTVGLPDGVLSLLQGTGATTGEALVRHPAISAVSFTGGTATGARIATVAAPHFKKLSLELGGKNPNLIFADCDYDRMLATTLRSSFQNQGQICLCGSRIYVERSLYDRFVEDFVAATQALTVGDPEETTTQVGAVVSQAHQQKILNAVDRAVQEGGRIETGGVVPEMAGRCAQGWFVAPTIITQLNEHCQTNQEEIFGPVVSVQPFDTVEQAVALANRSRYGLSASLWTRDMNRALSVARNVEVGVVWVNGWLVRDLRTPFGGMKDSGVGREGGWDAINFWTQTKNVCFCP